MKKYFIFIVLVIFSLTSCSQEIINSNNDNKKTEINKVLSKGESLKVIIYVSELPQNFSYPNTARWGRMERTSENKIENLEVMVNGKSSWVSFSAFSDLFNVRESEVIILEEGFQIFIVGGQSSALYEAHINFDNMGVLKSRIVKGSSFPNEAWEKTTYSYIKHNTGL